MSNVNPRVSLGVFVLLLVISACSSGDTASDADSGGSDAAESVLDFLPVDSAPPPCGTDAFDDNGACLVPTGKSLGDNIVESAGTAPLENLGWTVSLVLTADGIAQFNEVAASCFEMDETCPSGRLAIVSNGELVSAPTIAAPSFERDQIQVTGDFTQEEALELVEALNS